MQAELDSPKNEMEGLRRLNSTGSGSVSSVSSAGLPLTLRVGGAPSGRRTLSAQRRFPRWLRITGSSIGRRREVD